MALTEILTHIIRGLISIYPERKFLNHPKQLVHTPLISSANIGSQSSGNIREAYYKGDRGNWEALPWLNDRQMVQSAFIYHTRVAVQMPTGLGQLDRRTFVRNQQRRD